MTEALEARIAPASLSFVQRIANDPDVSDLVATDASGNIYVAGVFHSSFVQDGGLPEEGLVTSDPAGDVYVAKYSPAGELQWMRNWGGVGIENPKAITVDPTGNVYLTGSFDSSQAGFSGSTSFLSTTAGVPQLFAFKVLGTNGAPDLSWGIEGQTQFGGSAATAQGTAIVASSSGVYIGGHFEGLSVGFNHGTIAISPPDGKESMVIQLSSGGSPNPDWGTGGVAITSESVNADSVDRVFRIIVDPSGFVFAGTSTFNPAVSPAPAFATYSVVKLGAGGSPDSIFNNGQPLDIGGFTSVIPFDFALDSLGSIYSVQNLSNVTVVQRYTAAGVQDTSYGPAPGGGGTGGIAFINVNSKYLSAAIDSQDRLYVAGGTATSDFIARLTPNGLADTNFLGDGLGTFGKPRITTADGHVGLALGPSGEVVLRDSYVGSVDLDPTTKTKKLAPRSVGGGNQEGFLLRLDADAADPGGAVHVPAGTGPNGKPAEIVVRLTGPGTLHVTPGLFNFEGNIAAIELSDTTMASNLTVTGVNLSGTRSVLHIETLGAKDDVGSIKLTPDLAFGNGLADLVPELLVTGRLGKLVLGDVDLNALIRLGTGLEYNNLDPKVSDTYNNRPDLTLGTVGPGVIIDLVGDNQFKGTGGGGLGNVMIERWDQSGIIRTTQSIGNFTVKTGNFMGVLEIDKLHNGGDTDANVGMMDIQDGDWGSSGTEIEGNITSFNAEAFLAGATITAGSVGKVTTDAGNFSGTLTLTDTDAKHVPTFSIATDFTGVVISNSPLKKIVIKADFRGTLQAPSIAAVTAFSFLGNDADPADLKIRATDGLLGKITAKSGIVRNFTFMAENAAFSGLNVVLKNAGASTVGIENVTISALTIGPISVQLSGVKNVAGVDLTGIKHSVFTATSPNGANIGKVTVKLSGASGSSTGLSDVSFTGDTIGNVNVNVNKSGAAGTARGVVKALFHARLNLGSFTFAGDATEAQVDDLTLWSGGKIGAIAVSAKTAAMGILKNSQIYGGQLLDFAGATSDAQIRSRLAGASLAGLKTSGNLSSATICAGANIGAISVGGALEFSYVIAGLRLGADETTGGGDDTYQRAAKIASVTVKGALSATSISAGINRVDADFGNANDVLAPAEAGEGFSSEIGKVSIGAGVLLEGAPAMTHTFAIQAAKVAKILVKNQPALSNVVDPVVLDLGANGEDATDVIIRVLAAEG